MRPLDPVTSKQRVAYGFAFFVLFVALWAWVTFGGYVSKTFLANPLTMLHEGWELLVKYGFMFDIGMTIWRVVGGFVLAAIIAVPLGVVMGAYKPIEAFLEPFVSFARYLPASAFIPLLILWAGIGELQKLLVIFIGAVFQIILMVAINVGNTRRDLVEAITGSREGFYPPFARFESADLTPVRSQRLTPVKIRRRYEQAARLSAARQRG